MYRKNPISMMFLKGRHDKSMGLLQGLSPKRILDVGCDDGHFLRMLSERFPGARLVACDMDPAPVAEARKEAPGAEFVVCDFMEGKFGEADLVVMLEVMEHSPDPKGMLMRARSLLGRDGRILVSIPRPELWHWRAIWTIWSNTLGRRWQGQHSELTEKDLIRIAGECGLEPERRTRYFLGSISMMLLRKGRISGL